MFVIWEIISNKRNSWMRFLSYFTTFRYIYSTTANILKTSGSITNSSAFQNHVSRTCSSIWNLCFYLHFSLTFVFWFHIHLFSQFIITYLVFIFKPILQVVLFHWIFLWMSPGHWINLSLWMLIHTSNTYGPLFCMDQQVFNFFQFKKVPTLIWIFS